MKKALLMAAAALCIGTAATAQYKYEFTVVKENPATPVKNQAKTGTCWCFATTSFIESELIRMKSTVANNFYAIRNRNFC